jgi:hypothetical protein
VLVKNCCSYGGILDSSDMKGDVPERWLLHAIMRALHRIYDRGTRGMFNHEPGAFTLPGLSSCNELQLAEDDYETIFLRRAISNAWL